MPIPIPSETGVSTLKISSTGIQNKIQQYNTMITEKEAEIEETTLELEEAIRQQEAQYEAMKKRIKFMYEKAPPSPARRSPHSPVRSSLHTL